MRSTPASLGRRTGKKAALLSVLAVIFLGACADVHRDMVLADVSDDSLSRIKNIRYNKTLFTDSLTCFGRKVKSTVPPVIVDTLNKSMAGVSPIKDKTQKLYSGESTAISDMVANAMAKTGLIRVLDVEDTQNDRQNSFTNYLALKSGAGAQVASTSPHYAALVPRGVLFAPLLHVSGALTEFNDRETLNVNGEASFFGAEHKGNVIDVALDLRIISSSDGSISISNKGPNTISVANRIVAIRNSLNYFRIIHNSAFGATFAYEIGDPRYYAVRELVEYSVLELLSNTLDMNWREGCDIQKDSLSETFMLRDVR